MTKNEINENPAAATVLTDEQDYLNDASHPRDMQQAMQWIVGLRNRVDNLLDVINAESKSGVLAQAGATAEPVAYEQDSGTETELIYAAWFAQGRGKMNPDFIYRPLYLAAPAAPAQVPAAEVRAAYEQAAQIALKLTRIPRDLLGPATPPMKVTAKIGEKIAEEIRALTHSSTADKASEVRATEEGGA